MRTALLCGRWTLPFATGPVAEGQRALRERSYLHYVAEHRDMVGAKALATQWLLQGVPAPRFIVEFFAGAGIQTVLARGVAGVPKRHLAFEVSPECVEHLRGIGGVEVIEQDAREAMLDPRNAGDLVFCDYPSFTAMDWTDRWRAEMWSVFQREPTTIVVTDTSTSRLPLHRKRYGDMFGRAIVNRTDYACALSDWLYRYTGYRVRRVAWRGNNAGYYLLERPRSIATIEEAAFPVSQGSRGFMWLD